MRVLICDVCGETINKDKDFYDILRDAKERAESFQLCGAACLLRFAQQENSSTPVK